jgi:Tfp pilus assembly protein PilX
MNKKIAVLIVLVLLVLLGIGAYVMISKSSQSAASKTAPVANPTETTASKAEAQGTIKALLTSGVSQECTFSTKQQATTDGTAFLSDGKMRGDFTSTSQGQTINGHMIIASGYSYIWTDLTKRGMKIALTEGQASGSAQSQGLDVNQTVSYSCKPWVSDASKFTLPADVTFITFTLPKAAAPTGAGANPTGTATQCSACDSLPSSAQAVCKTQFCK